MMCPFCLHRKSEVYNSRSTNRGSTVWRRRRCLNCGKAFTTQESQDPSNLWKVKKYDTKHTPYSRAKLAMSVLRACDHRHNQDNEAWYLFTTIEELLFPVAAAGKHTITTADIIDKTAEVLKRFDAAAYIKYISYHQPTMDAGTLRKKLRRA